MNRVTLGWVELNSCSLLMRLSITLTPVQTTLSCNWYASSHWNHMITEFEKNVIDNSDNYSLWSYHSVFKIIKGSGTKHGFGVLRNVGSNPLSIVSLHWQVACLWTFVLKSIKMDIVPLTYRVIVQFQGDAISWPIA